MTLLPGGFLSKKISLSPKILGRHCFGRCAGDRAERLVVSAAEAGSASCSRTIWTAASTQAGLVIGVPSGASSRRTGPPGATASPISGRISAPSPAITHGAAYLAAFHAAQTSISERTEKIALSSARNLG